MKIVPITDTLSVAGQPAVAEIAALAGRGARLLIDNRPDGEEPGQPSALAVAAAAGSAGLGYLHLPVTGATIMREDVDRFRRAVEGAAGPVVAHAAAACAR